MTISTSIRLDFDEMPQELAQKLAAAIEGFVTFNFPQSCLHGSVVSSESGRITPYVHEPEGELIPGQVVEGMGITLHYGSDRYPATVTRWTPSQKTIHYVKDKYRRTDNNGMSEDQEYEFETVGVVDGPYGSNEETARWSEKRQRYQVLGSTTPLSKGRSAHYDFHK